MAIEAKIDRNAMNHDDAYDDDGDDDADGNDGDGDHR